MDSDNPIFLIPILIGPLLLIAGIVLYKYPPKKINCLYGYRTAASMHTQERWDYAQTYSGRMMIGSGAVLLICVVPAGLMNLECSEGTSVFIALGIMMIFILIPIIKTEIALKKFFGKF